MLKKCKWCGKEFEYTQGNKKYCCVDCRKLATRAKYDTNYRKKYYETHREQERRSAKQYYHSHKDKNRKKRHNYYMQHRERYLEYQKKYYMEHKADRSFRKKLDQCCDRYGGIDNCPFDDCICE